MLFRSALGEQRGTLAERTIQIEELRAAEALAVVNSVRGWRDAVLVSPD